MKSQMLALKCLRKALGLNTTQMAEELEISKSFYEKIELGYKRASNEFCRKIKAKFPFIDTNIFFK